MDSLTFILSGFISRTSVTFEWETSFEIPNLLALAAPCQSLGVAMMINGQHMLNLTHSEQGTI